MAVEPKYRYAFLVHNNDGKVVGKRESSSLEVIRQSLGDVPKWIENWERENLIQCSECDKYTLISDVSYEDEDEANKPICQICLVLILKGTQKIKEDK